MDNLPQAAPLIPAFQLAAFALLTASGRSFRRESVWIGGIFSLASFIVALAVLGGRLLGDADNYNGRFEWMRIGTFPIAMGYEVTNLTSLMLVIISALGLLTSVYAAGFMKQDERITVFYGYMALLQFATLGLALADNALTFYFFWIMTGIGMFLLIGFRYSDPQVKSAALQAFMAARLGDAALLAAMALLFFYMPGHSLDFVTIQNVFQNGGEAVPPGAANAAALLLALAAVAAAAQFPLFAWLPGAERTPLPAYALIQGVTVSAAGVYLLVRMQPLMAASPAAMAALYTIGGITALLGALIAAVQRDIRRILAYSTVSQTGYMLVALGMEAETACIFHLLTHALFKPLLLFAAGNVMQAANSTDLYALGKIGRRMPATAWIFGIGALAMAGIPPFAGFWSRDAIASVAMDSSVPLFMALAGAGFFTALYMTRLFLVMFAGFGQELPDEERSAPAVPAAPATSKTRVPPSQAGGSAAARENRLPAGLMLPPAALALLSVPAGLLETPWSGRLGTWLSGVYEAPHGGVNAMIVMAAASALGIYLGWMIYVKGTVRLRREELASRAPWAVPSLERGLYLEKAGRTLFLGTLITLGRLLLRCEDKTASAAGMAAAQAIGSSGRLLHRLLQTKGPVYGFLAVIAFIMLAAALAGRRFW